MEMHEPVEPHHALQETALRSSDVAGAEPNAPLALTPARLRALQRSVGNHAVNQILARARTGALGLMREPKIDLPKATPTGKIGDSDVIEFDIEPNSPPGQTNLKLSDERASPDYVDNRVESVGFGIYLFGCYLYVSGLDTPVFVPDAYIDLSTSKAHAVNQSVHPDRDTALAAASKADSPPAFAFYRAVGGMSVPTVFSDATTPRIMATLRAAKAELAEYVQKEMTVLALSLVGGMLVRGLVNRVMKIGTGPGKPPKLPEAGEPPPPAALKKGPQIIESAGASPKGGQFQSASAQTQKSMATAIRADIGESEAYKAALRNGEIGLERPQGTNVGGRGDFITARKTPSGDYEIVVTDVKTRTTETSKFPKPKTSMPGSWGVQVRDAISSARLKLGDPALEKAIVKAADEGRIWSRQVNVDYSPTGGGSITGL